MQFLVCLYCLMQPYSFCFFSDTGAGDPCLNNECLNGATCVPSADGYTCKCPAGFTGKYCQGEYSAEYTLPCFDCSFITNK